MLHKILCHLTAFELFQKPILDCYLQAGRSFGPIGPVLSPHFTFVDHEHVFMPRKSCSRAICSCALKPLS